MADGFHHFCDQKVFALIMDQKEFERYIDERYNDQCQWYSSKASLNKKRYYLVPDTDCLFFILDHANNRTGNLFSKF